MPNEIITEQGTPERGTGADGHVHAKGLKPIDGGKYQPSLDLLSTCVHCGLCLNHCPTYKTLGLEMDSPRGRIYQVLQVNEGAMDFNSSFAKHIDQCLGCLACEIACPSGVKYGRIVERARAQIESN
jgi:glycolate oxidase iron-sulfur subunit